MADHRALRLRLGALLSLLLRRGRFFFGALLHVRAFEVYAALERLLEKVRVATLGAFLRHRLVVRREVALGIIRAAPEHVAALGLAFGNVAGAALGALHSFDNVLLHVFALRSEEHTSELRHPSISYAVFC